MSMENKSTGGPDLSGIPEQEKLRLALSGLFSERAGFQHEIVSMKDPDKFSEAIDELSAVSVGLPCSKDRQEVSVAWVDQNGNFQKETSTRSLLTTVELMQIFMSPDWMASRKGAGYYADTALTQVLLGTGRTEVLEGIVGPGTYTKEEAVNIANDLIAKGKYTAEEKDSIAKAFDGSLRIEAVLVANIIKEKAARYRAQKVVWDAFGNHQQACGDEKSGSELFVTPGHSAPQGPDWKEFFHDKGNHRDKALRQIYAAGLSYRELIDSDNRDLLIKGIHYKVENGREIPLGGNVYAEGWTKGKFTNWMNALLDQTDGDLLAAYDAWYTSIVTGLVAKVAVDGVKVGDPPIVSSLDAWLLHFKEKQLNEAGLAIDGARKKYQIYKNKTGPIIGINKFPPSWLGSYFDEATIGENGDSVFSKWWNDRVPMGEINWANTDIQQQEEEVRLGSFDGWLYSKFQLYKMLAAVQGIPSLKDLSGYGYWEGMARSLDKAFGVVYDKGGVKADALWNQNCEKTRAERREINERRTVKRDGVEFVQVVPDSMNPRYQLVVGILDRYAPNIVKDPTGNSVDTAVSLRERFTHLSEIGLIRAGYTGNDLSKGNPGIPIESFIQTVVDAGLLTFNEIMKAIEETYGKSGKNAIIVNSPKIKSIIAGSR